MRNGSERRRARGRSSQKVNVWLFLGAGRSQSPNRVRTRTTSSVQNIFAKTALVYIVIRCHRSPLDAIKLWYLSNAYLLCCEPVLCHYQLMLCCLQISSAGDSRLENKDWAQMKPFLYLIAKHKKYCLAFRALSVNRWANTLALTLIYSICGLLLSKYEFNIRYEIHLISIWLSLVWRSDGLSVGIHYAFTICICNP